MSDKPRLTDEEREDIYRRSIYYTANVSKPTKRVKKVVEKKEPVVKQVEPEPIREVVPVKEVPVKVKEVVKPEPVKKPLKRGKAVAIVDTEDSDQSSFEGSESFSDSDSDSDIAIVRKPFKYNPPPTV